MADDLLSLFGSKPADQTGVLGAPENPLDLFGARSAPDTGKAVRIGLDKNPDEAAKIDDLSKKSGMPPAAIEVDPAAVEKDVKARLINDITTESPVTRDWLSNPTNAAIGQDSVPQLTEIERMAGITVATPEQQNITWEEGLEGLKGSAAKLRDIIVKPIGAGAVDFARGWQGLQLAIIENERTLTDPVREIFPGGIPGLLLSKEAADREQQAYESSIGTLERVANELFGSEGLQRDEQMVAQGFRSLGSNVPGAALSVLTGNPFPALALAGSTTSGLSYLDARKAGLTPLESAGYGTIQGAIEVGTEFVPGLDFAKKIKAGTPLFDLLGSQFVKENIGEQIATAGQDAVEWLTLHPEKSFGDYLDERPNAALETFVATSTATIAQTAIARAATLPFQKDMAEAQVATTNRQALDGMNAAITAAPMTARDVARVSEVSADSLKANGVQNVYIAAPAIAAAAEATGDPQALYRALGVENQIQEALVLGTDVRMPTRAFTDNALSTPLYQQLADHVRFGVDQMTSAEAQAFQQTGLQDEIERLGLEANLAGADTAAVRVDPLEKAADEALGLAENEMGLQALFRDAASAGMTEQQYTSYLLATAEARDMSRKRQEAKLIRQQLRESEAEWKKNRDLAKEASREEVSNIPIYALMNAIGGGGQRIDRQSIIDLMPERMVYNQETGANTMESSEQQLAALGLPKINGRDVFTNKTEKNGIHADVLAQQHGFNDGLEMLLALTEAEPQQAVIERLTDKRMNDTFGDLRNTVDGLREAIDSMHNDGQALLLAVELNALRQAKENGQLSAQQVRQVARQRLLEYDIKDLREDKFLAAERRESRNAAKLLRKGDRQGAAQAKFRQLLNFQMAREAIDLRNKVQKDAKYLNGWTKNKKRPNHSERFVSAIKQILTDYKIGNRISLAKRLDMEKMMYALGVEAGADVPLHPRLIEEDSKKNYQDLTAREWNDLVGGVRTLDAWSRRVKEMVIKGRKIDKAARKEKMLATTESLPDLSEAKVLKERESAGWWERKRMWLRNLHASFSKVEFAMQKLDGGDLGGIWHKTLFQPMVDAQSRKADAIKKYMKPLAQALADVPKSTKKSLAKDVWLGNKKGTRAELLGMALNVGNESNLSKMIGGSKNDRTGAQELTLESVNKALEQLTPEEAKWAQKVWDTFEAIYPNLEEVYADTYGEKPSKIEHRKFTLAGEKMRGGYYPAIYNAERTNNERVKETEDLFAKDGARDTIFSGMTKERTGFSAPMSLDINNLPRALEQVIHYYTHFDAVRDVRSLLKDGDVASRIKDKLGLAQYNEVKQWMEAIANPASLRVRGDESLNSIGQWARGNLISSVLGASMTTLASQTLGRFTSVAVLGRSEGGKFSALRGEYWLASGYLQAMSSREAVGQAFDASKELRTRAESVDRDVSYMMQKLQGRASPWSQAKRWSLMAIGYFQLYTVDLPTWMAGYNKALANGKSDAEAVNYADAVLRTSQGSGHIKDQSRIQRNQSAFVQMFTMFSTYTMLAYNLEAQTLGDARKVKNIPGAVLRLSYLIVMPALLDALMRQAGPGDDDDWETWGAMQSLKYAASTLPVGGNLLRGGSSPIEGLRDAVQSAMEDAEKSYDRDKEYSPAAIRRLVTAFGLLTGAPAVQINRTLKAMEEDDATIQDYLVGPRKE